MIVLIDNYDSFTYNLVQYLRELDQEVMVFYNDQFTIPQVIAAKPSHIIISPGPGRPETAGLIIPLIRKFYKKMPILGVCLGHQAIGAVFGGKVILAPLVMHGKTSMIHHHQLGLFAGIKLPFQAMRYNSLVLDPDSIGKDLQVSAWCYHPTNDVVDIMGIQHRRYPVVGVQFHPESIATECGHQLLRNFLEM